MTEMTSYVPGSFCWVDLATNDTDGAKAFYTGLFGWEAVDMPTDTGVPYTMLLKDGKQVCALYPMGPDHGGVPPHWQTYVSVDDLDSVSAAFPVHGGNVLMPPMDVMDVGRMSMVQDPTGAVLGLWQGKQHIGAALWNQPGAVCWNELLTHDVEKAKSFFAEVLGWTTKTSQKVLDGKYHLLINAEEQIGGLMQIEPEWGPMPSNWTVYLGVDDCDRSIADAQSRGATLLFPAMEIEGAGRFAYLQDPQGAVFAIIQHADQT